MFQIADILSQAWIYALNHSAEFAEALAVHLELVAVALLVSLLISVPMGIWTAYLARGGRQRQAAAWINAINSLRVVPSLAVLFLLIPYLGLTTLSAAVALTVLALPPVLLNTDAAFRGVDPAVREAARGMGMTFWQSLGRVEFPLALPVMLTGIRIAAVEVISSATLAAFVGSGGLGIYITRGFALYDYSILLVGAFPVALLTLTAETLLGGLQRAARPPA